jgi:hypothetical protein
MTKILRGIKLAESPNKVQSLLDAHLNEQENQLYGFQTPQLTIADFRLPPYLENLGIFCIGSPGSGKTQAIAQLLNTLSQRPDFRVICFDRNGEFTEKFYQSEQHLLFNPKDSRTVFWNHKKELVRPETIAAGIVPLDSHQEQFWTHTARNLLSDIYGRTDNNAQVWATLSTLSQRELKELLRDSAFYKYFDSEKTVASIIATLCTYTRFYRELPDNSESFSFSEWAKADDPRSLFLPLFEEDAELYKPLYSMIFELILKGLLSNRERKIKTAVVIDELGALQKLPSLVRLLSEGRKFNVCPILATQTQAQINRVYGEYDTQIILQGTATKLILNCRDPQTAETMADLIGKQERLEELSSSNSREQTIFIREAYAVMPSELQALPSLQGYLLIADGIPPVRVELTPKDYSNITSSCLLQAIDQNLNLQEAIQQLIAKISSRSQPNENRNNFTLDSSWLETFSLETTELSSTCLNSLPDLSQFNLDYEPNQIDIYDCEGLLISLTVDEVIYTAPRKSGFQPSYLMWIFDGQIGLLYSGQLILLDRITHLPCYQQAINLLQELSLINLF